MDFDPVELSKLGSEIVRISVQLRALRGDRDELNKKISELEKELRPFILRQHELMSTLIGEALPAPAPAAPAAPSGTVSSGAAPVASSGGSGTALKQKVLEFLRKCDETVSAGDIAESLHIDPALVREAMLELRRR